MPGYIGAIEHDRAAIRLQISRHHVDEGGLARAIGADQADLLTGRYLDRQRVGGDDGAKSLFQPARGKHRAHVGAPSSAADGVAAGSTVLRRSLIQSEPMPRGRNRMTASRKLPSTSCQVLGRYRFEKERTSSSASEATNTAETLWYPASTAMKTNSPEVVQ